MRTATRPRVPRRVPRRVARRGLAGGWLLLVASVVLVGTGVPRPVRAGDPPAPPAAPSEPHEIRIYDVSALVEGFPPFQGEAGPFAATPDQVNDVLHPPFGGERGDPATPCGGVPELIRLLQVALAPAFGDPGAAGDEGSEIATDFGGRLVVRATASVQAAVARVLGDLERAAFALVTLDVVAFRGDPAAVRSDGLSAAVARGDLVPLSGARAAGFAAAILVGRAGHEAAFVQDEDVEVAQKAKGGDPVVGIVKGGLAFRAALMSVRDDRVVAGVRAWWAKPSDARRIEIRPGGDPVELLEVEGRSIDTVFELSPGVWTLAASTGDVVFGVRATVRAPDHRTGTGTHVGGNAAIPATGPLEARVLDLRDVCSPVPSVRGTSIHLRPSNFTPPEPSAPAEPAPLLQSESVADFVRSTVDPAYWSVEGTSLEMHGGRLVVRADAPHLAAVEDRVARLRASLGRPTRVRATVLRLPLASFPELVAGLDDGATLLEDGGAALLARPGASVVDRGSVRCRPGRRSASVGGTARAYVGDYDVEIAASAFIGNPIVHTVLDGLSLDATAHPVGDGTSVLLGLRIDRGDWLGSRQVATPHGELECPTLGVACSYGATLLPLGGRRIVGAALHDGFVTLTIVGAAAD